MPFGIVVALMFMVIIAVPIAAVLGMLSFGLDAIYMDGRLRLAIGEFTWDKQKEFILVAIPMFILLGEIMLRAGIARRMYNAVAQWLPVTHAIEAAREVATGASLSTVHWSSSSVSRCSTCTQVDESCSMTLSTRARDSPCTSTLSRPSARRIERITMATVPTECSCSGVGSSTLGSRCVVSRISRSYARS